MARHHGKISNARRRPPAPTDFLLDRDGAVAISAALP